MNSLWLIIWRFQPLHLGHQLLIETSLKENPATLLLIGSTNKQDINNPYSFEWRKDLVTDIYDGNITIWALQDFPDDKDWKDCIISQLPNNIEKLTLYCGDKENDSAVKSLLSLEDTLPFSLKIQEIPRSIIPISATQIREWIQEKNFSQLQKYLSKKTLLFLGITL